MNHKEIETTARTPSVGADGVQPSKTYTPISEETANTFRSDLSLKPCGATVATIATMFLGVGFYRRTVAEGKEGGDESTFWNKVNTEAKPVV